jgi:hypothetical protein
MDVPLIYPGDPDFDTYLYSAPPPGSTWIDGQKILVVDPTTKLFRQVDRRELTDYLYGGEYEDRLTDLEDPYEFD